jgi:hypothetical protein
MDSYLAILGYLSHLWERQVGPRILLNSFCPRAAERGEDITFLLTLPELQVQVVAKKELVEPTSKPSLINQPLGGNPYCYIAFEGKEPRPWYTHVQVKNHSTKGVIATRFHGENCYNSQWCYKGGHIGSNRASLFDASNRGEKNSAFLTKGKYHAANIRQLCHG